MTRATVPLAALVVLLTIPGWCAPPDHPVVTWASDPVGPDDTVLVIGGGFGDAPQVHVGRIKDDAAAVADPWDAVEEPRTVVPVSVSEHSLAFLLPRDLEPGVFAFRVTSGSGQSATRALNLPDVWWMQGDEGKAATPDGWLRIFGKCLHMDGARVRLAMEGRDPLILLPVPADASEYDLPLDLPADLAPGSYEVAVHNGRGGDAAWMPAGTVEIVPPVQWKQDVFRITDFPGTAGEAIRAALDKAAENGGGIVLVPRGRYEVKGQLVVPDGTVLKGESQELVSLYWPDMDDPPASLITGTNYGIEELALYCQNHKTVVDVDPKSTRFRMHRVLIRANAFFMLGEPGATFRGRKAPQKTNEGRCIRVTSPNFQITECDVFASGTALFLNPWGFRAASGPWYGLVRDNRFAYGSQGYSLECIDGLVFEDNEVVGSGLAPGGNAFSTFWNNFSRNVYFAGNAIHGQYGLDREMMTLDAAGGAYFGKVASVNGTHLTLAADPEFRDYHPTTHHSDYRGGVVMILDGTGAGQYRVVTANEGREWDLDRPWDIEPDETSVIQIGPHRGRHLFVNNVFYDGGAFQLYGAALDTIVAGNVGARMDGFFAWGLNPHGWGWQPAWYCQFLGNEISQGNGYGPRAAFMGAFGSNNNETYPGPLVRGAIFRRNDLLNNARFRIHSTVDGAVVDHNTVRDNEIGIDIGKGPRNVVLRANTFDDVATPHSGEGLGQATIVE